MRFVIHARVRPEAKPPEDQKAAIEAVRAYHARYRDRVQFYSIIPASKGGFAIADVSDINELRDIINDYPFLQNMEFSIEPVVTWEESLAYNEARLLARAGD